MWHKKTKRTIREWFDIVDTKNGWNRSTGVSAPEGYNWVGPIDHVMYLRHVRRTNRRLFGDVDRTSGRLFAEWRPRVAREQWRARGLRRRGRWRDRRAGRWNTIADANTNGDADSDAGAGADAYAGSNADLDVDVDGFDPDVDIAYRHSAVSLKTRHATKDPSHGDSSALAFAFSSASASASASGQPSSSTRPAFRPTSASLRRVTTSLVFYQNHDSHA